MSTTMINPILSLRVVTFNDQPVAEPLSIAFGPAGGTIGRATDCTLALPDPQRAISRVQARIEYRDGEYFLCDAGSNPSVLNHRPLGGTREARLAHGDRLEIGAYLLEVQLQDGGDEGSGSNGRRYGIDTLASAKVLHATMNSGAPDPFALAALDPLGQPGFGEEPRIAARPGYSGSESDHAPPEQHALSRSIAGGPGQGMAYAPAAARAMPGLIPHDYDPFAEPSLAARPLTGPPPAGPASMPSSFDASTQPHAQGTLPEPSGGPSGLPASLLDPVVGGSAPTPFDDLLAPFSSVASAAPVPALGPSPFPSPTGGAVARPEPARPHQSGTPGARQPYLPEMTLMPRPGSMPELNEMARESERASLRDGGAMNLKSPVEPLSSPPSISQQSDEPLARSEPFESQLPTDAPLVGQLDAQPATRPSEPSASTVSPAPNADPTLAALLEGLGIDSRHAPTLLPPDLARLIGTMLRESLGGTMAVLRSRTMTKREARLDATMIVARDNNPLKFFPDVDSALLQMFSGRSTGYLAPAEAVHRAFGDLAAHELAVMAGMRAALAHVLQRFDPAAIEAQLDAQGGMKVMLNRKAKLWERFVELQGGIERAAADDFQKLFGDAFNEAYEQQIEALRENDRAPNSQPK
jgi:type VI secretion system protein